MSSPFVCACSAIVAALLCLTGCGASSAPVPQASKLPSYTLTVAAPASGAGTITSSPAGINCPKTCSATFPQNTQIQLVATPGGSYFFAGWSGGCSGSAPCTVSMNAAETISAVFTPGEQLNVTLTGTGTGIVTSSPPGIHCPTTCSAAFPQNTEVTLTESPEGNAAFTSWDGACTGAANCSVTLAASGSVVANFAASTPGDGPGSAALVYVSSNASGNSSQTHADIDAYTADSNGQLTPAQGSPFSVNTVAIAANKNFIFATDGVNISSFSIATDGAITQVGSVNAQQFDSPNNCGNPIVLFLDRSGTALYDLDYVSDCANNQYQSFNIDASTGALSFLGITSAASPVFEKGLSFLGNNQYGFSASCYHFYQEIYGFKRNSDGSLTSITDFGKAAPLPNAPSGDAYCPWLAAADASNHLAVTLTAVDGSTFQTTGAPLLAAYTVDDSGALTTTSTAASMPQVATGSVNDLQFSPSGTFLAVAGTGLQIFQFNGANPITQFTGLLVNDPIDQIVWDNANHLYAISKTAGKLFVFTVNSTGATEAPGSPYVIAQPGNIAVVPLT